MVMVTAVVMVAAVVVMVVVPKSPEGEANARPVQVTIVVRIGAVVVCIVVPNPLTMQMAAMSPAATDPFDVLHRRVLVGCCSQIHRSTAQWRSLGRC